MVEVGVGVLGREYFRCILVSVGVGLWKMLMLRQVGVLVIERSWKWIVSTYCRTLSGLMRVESQMSKISSTYLV